MALTADILTYNAGIVYGVFSGISRMFSSGFFKELIFLTFSAAYAYTIVTNVQQGDVKKSIIHLFYALLFLGVLVVQHGNVIIHDQVLNEKRSVEKVPLGMVIIGGFVSQTFDFITQSFETHFSIPDDSFFSFRRYGTLFGSKLIREAQEARIQSPNLSRNMNQFMAQCIVPDVRIKARYTLDEVVKSPNPWEIIKTKTSPLRGFEYYDGTRHIFKICRDGAILLDKDLQQEAAIQEQSIKWKLESKFGGRNDTALNQKTKSLMADAVRNQLPMAHKFFMDMTGNSFDILKQHMIRNYITEIPQRFAMMKGASSAAQAYGLARAELAQQNSIWISGALAPDNLLKLYTIFQAIAYASFPLIILLIPFPIGWSVVSTYIGVLVWIHSWPVFFAVVNYIQNESLYSALSSAAQTVTGLGTDGAQTVAGWTVMNSPALAKANLEVSQMAGMLTASIPVIALILVKGAAQAVHVASNWFAKGDSAAQSSADRMTDGDVSGGNLNVNNRSAYNDSMYHVNTKPSYSGAGANMELMSGTQMNITGQGEHILNQSPGLSQTASSFRLSDMMQSSISKQSQQSLNAVQTDQAAYAQALGSTMNSAMQLAMNGGISESSGVNYGSGDGFNINTTASEITKLTQQFARDNSITEQQAARVLMGAHAAVKAGVDFKAVGGDGGLNGSLTYNNDSVADDRASKAVTFVKETGLDRKYDQLVKASKDLSYNSNSHVNDSLTEQHTSNLDSLQRASNDYQSSLQRHKSISKLAQESQTHSAAVDYNLQNFVVDKLAHEYGTARADEILRDPVKARSHVEQIIGNHMGEVSAIYQSNAITEEQITQHYGVGKDQVDLAQSTIKATSAAEQSNIEQTALTKGIDMQNPKFINKEAQTQYSNLSKQVENKVATDTVAINTKGQQHADMVDDMRDQTKEGLIKRSLSHITDNVGGRDKIDQ